MYVHSSYALSTTTTLFSLFYLYASFYPLLFNLSSHSAFPTNIQIFLSRFISSRLSFSTPSLLIYFIFISSHLISSPLYSSLPISYLLLPLLLISSLLLFPHLFSFHLLSHNISSFSHYLCSMFIFSFLTHLWIHHARSAYSHPFWCVSTAPRSTHHSDITNHHIK